MTFDALATAVDWLDAYRAGDIDAILAMYACEATVECGCDGLKIINGQQALRAYWKQRLADFPASELDDLKLSSDLTTISYITPGGKVSATMTFNSNGKIALLRCGPQG